MSNLLRVLIVDDEPLACQRLLDLLAQMDDVEVAGTADSGKTAVKAIRVNRPDLVLLDVQMPGLTGLDVVREIGPQHMPVTVFVTAYDQHALAAFELAALDYLLKPFEDERFFQTVQRARETIRLRKVGELQDSLLRLLQGRAQEGPANSPTPKSAYMERVAVEMRGQVRVVPVEQIDFIAADGAYAELHVGEKTYVIRERMQNLEERLDPKRFFRIHRSTIVQLDRVEALLTASGGDYAVRLSDGKRLRVSRGRRDELAMSLGLDGLQKETS